MILKSLQELPIKKSSGLKRELYTGIRNAWAYALKHPACSYEYVFLTNIKPVLNRHGRNESMQEITKRSTDLRVLHTLLTSSK